MKASLEKVGKAYGITEYRLNNGLRVLHKYDKTLPIAAVCVTYHVGSRNEAPGHTGATHILEHLMFKDSEHFRKEDGRELMPYLEWRGAVWNATTWLDRTNYFELMPKERVGEALEMEADRMRGSLFNDQDLASEMTVVRNEYERGRNNPYEILDEAVDEAAFTSHPYRIPTIGTKEDIENSTAAKLREFYDRFYWPNNATLLIFGDVEATEAERLAIKHFGKISPSAQPIPKMEAVEPDQENPRTVSVRKAAGVSIASITYKAPRGTDEDYLPLYAFAVALAGGFSSRMQQQIVDKGYAADISCSMFPMHDPHLVSFTSTVGKNATPEDVIARMRASIKKAVKDGITKAEASRSSERLLAQMTGDRDGTFDEMRAVSESIAAGDWKLRYDFEKRIPKLTSAEINGAARRWLLPKRETTGILHDTL